MRRGKGGRESIENEGACRIEIVSIERVPELSFLKKNVRWTPELSVRIAIASEAVCCKENVATSFDEVIPCVMISREILQVPPPTPIRLTVTSLKPESGITRMTEETEAPESTVMLESRNNRCDVPF